MPPADTPGIAVNDIGSHPNTGTEQTLTLTADETIQMIDALIYGEVVALRYAQTAETAGDFVAARFHHENAAVCAVLFRLIRDRLADPVP